jgi:hypothetical protein
MHVYTYFRLERTEKTGPRMCVSIFISFLAKVVSYIAINDGFVQRLALCGRVCVCMCVRGGRGGYKIKMCKWLDETCSKSESKHIIVLLCPAKQYYNSLCINTVYTSLVHTLLVYTSLVHTSLAHTSLVYTSLVHTSLVHTSLVHTSLVHTSLVHTSLAHTSLVYTSLVQTFFNIQ